MAFPTNLPVQNNNGLAIVQALEAIYNGGGGLPTGISTAAKQDEQTALLAVNADGLNISAAVKSVYDKLINGGLSAADLLTSINSYLPSIAAAVTRPSLVTGRSLVQITGKATVTGSVYTVTPGKKLYITTIYCSSIFSVAGVLVIKDNTTVKAGSGSGTDPQIGGLAGLPTPMQFDTNVTIDKDGGTFTSCYYTLIGWEG